MPFTCRTGGTPRRMDLYFPAPFPAAGGRVSPAAFLRAHDAAAPVSPAIPPPSAGCRPSTGRACSWPATSTPPPTIPRASSSTSRSARRAGGSPAQGARGRHHVVVTPEFLAVYGVTLATSTPPVPAARALRGEAATGNTSRCSRWRPRPRDRARGRTAGTAPGRPDPVWHVAAWRDLLVLLALAAAGQRGARRRRAALAFATCSPDRLGVLGGRPRRAPTACSRSRHDGLGRRRRRRRRAAGEDGWWPASPRGRGGGGPSRTVSRRTW